MALHDKFPRFTSHYSSDSKKATPSFPKRGPPIIIIMTYFSLLAPALSRLFCLSMSGMEVCFILHRFFSYHGARIKSLTTSPTGITKKRVEFPG